MRIITGKAKGLKLKSPKGLSTRPTSDRIKESLFSILTGLTDFDGKIVLDLFAGTGALALEALSRGAAQAVFVDKETTDIIRDNLNRAHFSSDSEILRVDFLKAIKNLANQQKIFDLIFCDPPYAKNLCQQALNQVAQFEILSENGIFVAEHGFEEILEVPVNFEVMRQVKYGKTTAIDLFQKKVSAATL